MKRERNKDRLRPELLKSRLGSSMFSKNIIIHKKIESTNILAKELALRGAPEGTIVLAEEQTAGKGRMDRRWFSEGYSNILASLLLRPSMALDRIFILTMILAVAISYVIKEKYQLKAMIKWPNDIYIGRKKLGGILSEFSLKKREVKYVILGIGLNVNWYPEEKHGILYPSTSLFMERGELISRNVLFSDILMRFEGYYKDVLLGRIEQVYRKWNELSMVMGKAVEIETQVEKIKGKVLRIDHQGALVIKRDDGEEQTILSGDVSLRL
jgi:BirA family biotin operon repressor/biotin-[acetyl-CoA-carboxylase] ligase